MSDTAILEWRRARDSGLRTRLGVPAIRIPVTRENRAVLRELRARELALWEGPASGSSGAVSNRVEVPQEDRESLAILLLLGGAALALWLQAATAAVRFVEGWDLFRGWLASVLG